MIDAETQDRFDDETDGYDAFTRAAEQARLDELDRLFAERAERERAFAKAIQELGFLSLWERWSRRDTAHPDEVIEGFLLISDDTARDELVDGDKVAEARAIAEQS